MSPAIHGLEISRSFWLPFEKCCRMVGGISPRFRLLQSASHPHLPYGTHCRAVRALRSFADLASGRLETVTCAVLGTVGSHGSTLRQLRRMVSRLPIRACRVASPPFGPAIAVNLEPDGGWRGSPLSFGHPRATHSGIRCVSSGAWRPGGSAMTQTICCIQANSPYVATWDCPSSYVRGLSKIQLRGPGGRVPTQPRYPRPPRSARLPRLAGWCMSKYDYPGSSCKGKF